MNPYGTDRVRPAPDGGWIIASRRSKGWRPRVAKTLTSPEHPGTAVLWDGDYYEVIAAEPAAGGVRYRLQPWGDTHAIRLTDWYDAESEARREAEWQKAAAREKGRVAANALGLLTGHLPAVVQEHLGSETGILPVRLTQISLLGPLAFEIYVGLRVSARLIDMSNPPVRLWMIVAALYLFFETFIRFMVAWSQNRPIGSAAGLLAYGIYWSTSGRKQGAPSPFLVQRGTSVAIGDAPPEIALQDAFTVREPLVTLLAPIEQEALAQRFGYDYRRHSTAVALLIFFFSAAGVVTSIATLRYGLAFTTLLSLATAALVAGEQVYRLTHLRRGPVGSFLAVFVRPLVRVLFA